MDKKELVQHDTSETQLAVIYGHSSLLAIYLGKTDRLGASRPTLLQEPDLSEENIRKLVAESSLTDEQAKSWILNS